jgi:hypothetical protein
MRLRWSAVNGVCPSERLVTPYAREGHGQHWVPSSEFVPLKEFVTVAVGLAPPVALDLDPVGLIAGAVGEVAAL